MRLSDRPHARIVSIDSREASRFRGVRAIITGRDIPGENQVGVIVPDQPVLATDKVRYAGECVAIVAAQTREAARAASDLLRVRYRDLPAVYDPREALSDGAPWVHACGNLVIHFKIRAGNAGRALANSALVIERTFRTGPQEHMYLEPQSALAVPAPDNTYTIYGSMQCPFYVQRAVARVLGVQLSQVRVVQTVTGGGFGGKEDVPSEICARAALLAWATRRPVKLVLERRDDVQTSSKRHPMQLTYKVGASRDGKLQAAHVQIYADAGAYATLSTVVPWRSTVHAVGPYVVPNVHVDTLVAYTNHAPSGAFRGFGGPQSTYAAEAMLDEVALRLGIDPIELRLRNALKEGSRTITGHRLTESVGLVETLKLARGAAGWTRSRNVRGKTGGRFQRGIGVASTYYGVSLGARGWTLDGSGAYVQIHQDGSVSVAVGGTEMGQGALTALAQIAAESLGIPVKAVKMLPVDTRLVPDSGPSVASRVTVMSGNAILDATRKLRKDLLRVAGEMLDAPPSQLRMEGGAVLIARSPRRRGLAFSELVQACFRRNVNLAQEGWAVAPRGSWDDETGQGQAYYVYAFATHIAQVRVDTRTGRIAVEKVVAAHDVGRAINPQGIEGQVEGGVAQGFGYAVCEKFETPSGKARAPDFSTYLLPTSLDVPDVQTIVVESPSKDGPFGAKGVGEPALIPAPAAISNAVSDALGIRMCELPMTPEVVLSALRASGKKGQGRA
jgi:CO/xanthine dehydrogenase Mo-binding subunit